MKLRHEARGHAPRRIRSETILSIALSAAVLVGCKADARDYEYRRERESPYVVSPPAYRSGPSPPSPLAPPAKAPLILPSTQPAAGTPAPSPSVCRDSPEEMAGALAASGYGSLAEIITGRIMQERRKMKLSAQEGASLSCYLLTDLPLMPNALLLSKVMPKAAIELVRSVNERGVPRSEAEKMASFMLRLRESLRMRNPGPLDENTSHCIGREWSQIDYSGEGMTWQAQMDSYAPRGVPDFKTAASLRRFFEIESRMRYFKRLYRPEGPIPQ